MLLAKHLVAAGIACGFALVGGQAWAINKCVDASGRTSFQDAPCATGQKSQEVTVTPSSKGINPTEGSKPIGSAVSPAPVAAAPADQRPADCPDVEEMQKMQSQADSIALPLPIRNQLRQDFEAVRQRCG